MREDCRESAVEGADCCSPGAGDDDGWIAHGDAPRFRLTYISGNWQSLEHKSNAKTGCRHFSAAARESLIRLLCERFAASHKEIVTSLLLRLQSQLEEYP
jgi:hypothetical protein